MSRLEPQAIAEFLAQTVVLRACPMEVLQKLAPRVEQLSFDAGKAIVGPGVPVQTLNFLLSGRASVEIADVATATRVQIEEAHAGDTLGEVGFLLGGASPVLVFASEACEVLSIQRGHFDKIAAVLPDATQALVKRVAMRFVKVSVISARRAPPAPEPSKPSVDASAPAAPTQTSAMPPGAVPFVEIGSYQLSSRVLEMIPTRLILEHRLLPLELRGRTLVVGMVTPSSHAAKTELRKALHSVDPEIVAISADDYAQTLVRLKIDIRDKAQQGMVAGRSLRPAYQAEVKKEAEKQLQVIGDEVVNLLDRILMEAVDRKVSDVHIEPEASGVRVRFRVQGMLQERKETIPVGWAAPLVARIKVLSELDITDRRLPQDGRIAAQIGTRELNFRVSTLASARGEKVVIRILDPADVMRPLEQLFYDPRALDMVKRAISASHGAVVVAGATGSGKSSTLYSLLNQRKITRPDNNIVTVEDPIEFLFPGITQSPVNTKFGLEYPVVVRALMRQDPDVIMIGELRDSTTAGIAMEAALTGHIVMTTTHGSNVAATVQRFLQFGVEPMRLAYGLSLVVVQKLVRRLCAACVREDEIAPQLADALLARRLIVKGAGIKFPRAAGCEACNMTGYLGRLPVVETLFMDDELRALLGSGSSVHDVLEKARASGKFLPFSECAKMLMARKALTPADAFAATD